jgi:hypothetical protein
VNIPDFGHLTLGQIAGYLVPLAGLVFACGFVRAAVSAVLLWTYVKDWLVSWLAPVFVLLALAAVGQGVPGLGIEPNGAVQLIFIPAALAYVASALASIAKSVGVDLSRLPFASQVRTVWEEPAVKAPPTGL